MKKLVATAALALFITSPAIAKDLTPRQAKTFQDLRDIGLTEEDARNVALDPGVKKSEWGWVCESGKLKREKGAGARHKRNAVCE